MSEQSIQIIHYVLHINCFFFNHILKVGPKIIPKKKHLHIKYDIFFQKSKITVKNYNIRKFWFYIRLG